MIKVDVLFEFEKEVEIMQGEVRAEHRTHFLNKGNSTEKRKFCTIKLLEVVPCS